MSAARGWRGWLLGALLLCVLMPAAEAGWLGAAETPLPALKMPVSAQDVTPAVANANTAAQATAATPWFAWSVLLLYAGIAALLALLWWLRWRHRQAERERQQEAVARSEALLKHSLWASRGELWDADLRSGKIERTNRLEHLKVTQQAPQDDLGSYAPFVHVEDQAGFQRAMQAHLKGLSEDFEYSYRVQDQQGEWRWLLSRGRAIERDASGRALRMVGTTFDVTELRANEARLAESEERLKLALWGSNDELWDIDLLTGAIRRDNRLPSTSLGDELSFPTLSSYLAFVHPEDGERLHRAFVSHIKGDSEHFECDYRIRSAAGGWVWVLGRGRVVERRADGMALRMVGTNRDVSLLKQAEAELRELNEDLESRVQSRTAALAQTNAELTRTLDQLRLTQGQLVESEKLAALGGLVAGVAHEINTPMGVAVTAASHLAEASRRFAAQLNTGAVRKSSLDEYSRDAERSAELILANLRRASELVRSFKQVAVDQSSEQRRSFPLREYLDEILTSLHPRLKRTRVQVNVDGPSDLLLDTYPGALYQIIVNLVMNSLIHGFGDKLQGRIQISIQREGSEVLIDYRDNGAGMDETTRRRVFEPFFTTRRGSGGTGLGLHIVYNLATRLLRGQVRCDSAPGQGARFLLRFPQRVTAEAPP